MLAVYHAPMTRSFRVLWLLEELEIPHEIRRVDFVPPAKGGFFSQQTPLKKFPVLEDGDTVIFESGAIVEYVLERYGQGRLAPAIGSPQRGPFLQWLHFAEGTAFPPIGTIVWHTFYKRDVEALPEVIEDARGRARAGFEILAGALEEKDYLLGDEFSAADIMLGYTLIVARTVGVLGDEDKVLMEYLGRLESRPAFQRAAAV